MEEALLFGVQENVVYLKVVGHITAKLCGSLKLRTQESVSSLPASRGVFIDLADCTYMDSTFIGLLIGLNKQFSKKFGLRLVLFRVNDTCRKLLEGLGVASLFDYRTDEIELPKNLQDLSDKEKTSPELLLQVHEDLMDVSPANRARFSGLHSILKAKIEPKDKPGS